MSIQQVMSTPADTERMLSEMTRAEKAELLRWIVRDLGETPREYAYIADRELGVVHDLTALVGRWK